MRLIDRNDIELWASKIDSKGYFPILISRLVKATTPLSTLTEFPSGTAANVEGWDGIVSCQENCGYVPEGISLWEFGTEKSVNSKAEGDYLKRTKDSLGYDTKQSTFIFITPRFWRDKERFRQKKLEEGVWADVRVYDCRNLEEWLDDAIAVSRWFSQQLSKVPNDGVITTEEFWKEWAYGPGIEFPPAIVTSGRERESRELYEFLSAEANIKGVKASTKDEAIAFIIASAKQFEKQHFDRFFSKTLIVDKDYSFRTLRAHQHKLNLIAKFEDIKILFSGVIEGHHVLVPLGADDTFNNDFILLPDLPREGQVAALELAGLTEIDAQKFSREAARNLTVLKRLLKFPQSKIEWLNPAYIEEIFPALLVGRWSEGSEGDVEILEVLSGQKYADFKENLYKWRDLPESPILQIGHTWRLTSPLDAWSNIGPFLKPKHFELLKDIFLQTFKVIDLGDLVETDGLKLGFRKPKKYSRWTREGLVQSLILIGLYGDGLRLSTSIDAQYWVDSVVKELLRDADSQLWMSLDHEMPLIAEASPAVFLEYVNFSLISEEKAIMGMFTPIPGLFSDHSDHTGLLWALEALAWIPEYLTETAVILARIAKLKPEIKILNQPINSLKEIFKSWHYQTLADFEQRMSAVQAVIEVDYQTGWSLLLSMLPSNHGVAHPTHTLRWRLLGEPVGLEYTYDELFNTYSAVVDLLIADFKGSEADLADLVNKSDQIYNTEDRNRLLKFVESMADKFSGSKHLVWKELRKTLSQHRSHPDADWSMPESDLEYYDKLYLLYEPTDPLDRYVWLFDDHWLDFPEGKSKDDSSSIDVQNLKIQERRREAANYIFQNYGLKKVKELASVVKEPWLFGQTFAEIQPIEIHNEDLRFFLNNGSGPLKFIQGFFALKGHQKPAEWSLKFSKELQSKGLSPQELSKILAVLDQNTEIWSYLESNSELAQTYWQTISPFFYRLSEEEKIIGLSYLIKYKRFFTAIDEAANYLDSLPTDLIVQMLTVAATDKADEDRQPPLYDIGKLFETLENRTDADKGTLIRLEWLYIEILDRHQTGRSPKLIHEELLKDPDFFVEVIKLVYMPKGKDEAVTETIETDLERAAQIATKAYRLLREIKKVPGYQDEATFDGEFLKKWVLKVRSLAEQADRLEVTDSQLGHIFAQYPEDRKSDWPPEPIAQLIEAINTQSLKSGFSSATFNKRGSSARGPFDGGNIERGHAQYFERLAANYRIRFPNLAKILSDLAKGYREDAKHMDEQAKRDKLDH